LSYLERFKKKKKEKTKGFVKGNGKIKPDKKNKMIDIKEKKKQKKDDVEKDREMVGTVRDWIGLCFRFRRVVGSVGRRVRIFAHARRTQPQ